ncbi:MAG TPA: hypothetical protein VIH17_01990 [Candidatus Acidoferrales bacterium]
MAGQARKPRLLYTLVCDDVRQEVGDKISLMGLFDSIYAPVLPAFHPRIVVVNAWGSGRGRFQSTIRLLGPGRELVGDLGAAEFELADESRFHRHVAFHLNWQITSPGTYWIEVLLDGTREALVPLQVVSGGPVSAAIH